MLLPVVTIASVRNFVVDEQVLVVGTIMLISCWRTTSERFRWMNYQGGVSAHDYYYVVGDYACYGDRRTLTYTVQVFMFSQFISLL